MESGILETYLGLNPRFLGVFAKDTLPNEIPAGSCLVANLQRSDEGGSHWVAMAKLPDGRGFYFDPFGFAADPEFVRILGSGYIRNLQQYQPVKSKLCGYYCYYFCKNYLDGKNIYDILHKELIPAPRMKNDRVVREFMVGRGIYITHPGSLKFFGYHAKNSPTKRRISLLLASRTYGVEKVIQKINGVRSLSIRNPELYEIYSQDLDFLKALRNGR